MDIQVFGLDLKVNPQTEAYARRKLERLDRYLPGITDVRLELSRQNTKRGEDQNRAQLTVRHRRGAILRVDESSGGEIELVINQAVDKMYTRIQRFRGKRVSKRIRERYAASQEELQLAEALPEPEMPAPEAEAAMDGAIVRRKNISVTAMTEEEAIEQMELLGHTFFVFYNTDTAGINVVYKRLDGGYGVLSPQVE